jgi:dihydroorotate dehydrogenase
MLKSLTSALPHCSNWLATHREHPAVLRQLFAPATRGLGQTVAGLTFAHPIGLAAGFDKHADLTHGMALLGFSHIEVGTVTPRPKQATPSRACSAWSKTLPSSIVWASIVWGWTSLRHASATRPLQLPVGINIGKNRDTDLADATADYLSAFTTLAPHADYVAVNISSPNTPGLRQLHETAALRELLDALRAANQWQRPIFLKISPDESLAQLEQVIATAMTAGISGIIATNTTVSRPNLHSANASEVGGLSGAPLRDPAMTTLRHVARLTDGTLPIISVGESVALKTSMPGYGLGQVSYNSTPPWSITGCHRRSVIVGAGCVTAPRWRQ